MKNTIFPNKIHLLGEVYTIKECLRDDLKCKECQEECMGKCDFDKKTIYVATDDPENTPEDIFFHEIGHYFADYYALGSNEMFAEGFGKFIKLIINQLGYKKDDN